jgi:hypothetical protein
MNEPVNPETAFEIPVKSKHRFVGGVIKNGAYKPRTGNSHPKPPRMKRVPRASGRART